MDEELLKEFDKKSILELTNKLFLLKLLRFCLYERSEKLYSFEELDKLFPNKLSKDGIYKVPKID